MVSTIWLVSQISSDMRQAEICLYSVRSYEAGLVVAFPPAKEFLE